jgi:hypothetical protein
MGYPRRWRSIREALGVLRVFDRFSLIIGVPELKHDDLVGIVIRIATRQVLPINPCPTLAPDHPKLEPALAHYYS